VEFAVCAPLDHCVLDSMLLYSIVVYHVCMWVCVCTCPALTLRTLKVKVGKGKYLYSALFVVPHIGAEPTGAMGHLPRYFQKYRGKHIFLPRYFLAHNFTYCILVIRV